MKLREKTIEVLYKTYSKDICGYFANLPSGQYIVINDRLPHGNDIYTRLIELSAANSECDFVLLHSNGQIYKTENLEFLERVC